MNIERATVETVGANQVRICAPPWIVSARVEVRGGRPVLADLHVEHEDGITAARLASLPVRHITALAAATAWGAEETMYRMLATPAGDRRWSGRPHSRDHYQRVERVAEWAARSARAGGPAVCVAQFWGVHVRTARRWLAQVRLDG